MGKQSARSHSLINKITTFILMISLTLGTNRGRTLITSIVDKFNLLDKGVKIGFKIFLYVFVLLTLYFIKKWIFG